MRKWEDIDKHQTVATKEELSIIDTLSFLEVQRIKQGISQTEFAKKIGADFYSKDAMETVAIAKKVFNN